jgi:hypothetical protein
VVFLLTKTTKCCSIKKVIYHFYKTTIQSNIMLSEQAPQVNYQVSAEFISSQLESQLQQPFQSENPSLKPKIGNIETKPSFPKPTLNNPEVTNAPRQSEEGNWIIPKVTTGENTNPNQLPQQKSADKPSKEKPPIDSCTTPKL